MLSLKNLSKLQQKKYRQEYGLFLVEGKKTIQEALASQQTIEQIVMTRQFAEQQNEGFPTQNVAIVSDAEFHQLTETVHPEGVIAVLPLPQAKLDLFLTTTNDTQPQQIAILEDIRDPGNLGTMIRTADWFGLDGLLLLGGADPYQPKVVRASMGSLFHLPILHQNSQEQHVSLNQLKAAGFKLLVTRPELASPTTITNTSNLAAHKIALIFGNEAHGTSTAVDHLADQSISIPRYGQAESLNVAVSFGILLSQLKDYNKNHAISVP